MTSGASFMGNQLSIAAGLVVPLVDRPARASPPVGGPRQRAEDHAAEHTAHPPAASPHGQLVGTVKRNWAGASTGLARCLIVVVRRLISFRG